MDKSKMLERDHGIDIVKGSCILLMVLGHLPRVGSCRDALESVVSWIYTFHMPIFVFITGYLFGHKMFSGREILKICQRMLKPYFVMAVISYWLYALADALGLQVTCVHDSYSVVRLAKGILTGFGGGALWYLFTFGLCEIIVLCCKRLVRNELFVCVMAMSVLKVMSVLGFNVHYSLILYFAIGYFVRVVGSKIPATPYAVLPLVLIICFAGFPTDAVAPIWALAVLTLMLWAANVITAKAVFWATPLEFIGRHTLAILLFHNIISVVLRPVGLKLLYIEPTGICFGLVMTAIVTGACLATEMVIRKTILRYLFFDEIAFIRMGKQR